MNDAWHGLQKAAVFLLIFYGAFRIALDLATGIGPALLERVCQ